MDTMLCEDVAGLGTWQSASRKAKREAYVPLGAPQLDASRSEKSICVQTIVPRKICVRAAWLI